MCEKAGESLIAPITTTATGADTVATGWACNKTECPSYGKWYCPFSW